MIMVVKITISSAVTLSFMFYIIPQLLQITPQICCIALPIDVRFDKQYIDSGLVESIDPKTSSFGLSATMGLIPGAPHSTTQSYSHHTIATSSTGIQLDAGVSANLHSKSIAQSCLDHSNHVYYTCFRKFIIRAPHLSIRFAGRSLRVAQTCHTLAIHQLERCQKQFLAVDSTKNQIYS